jgi:DnaK suppressor protein
MQRKAHQINPSADVHEWLLAERSQIISGREDGLEVLATSGNLALDDQAALLHEQFVALQQRGMNQQKLKLIDQALARLERGDFGVCEQCSEAIPRKRLSVIPWAAYCVGCQEGFDQGRTLKERTLSLVA